MRRIIPALLLLAACKEDRVAPALCQQSLERARSLLAVPDTVAARDWVTQARQQCGATPPPDLADIEKRIAGIERAAAEASARRQAEASPKPLPPEKSAIPGFVEAVARYRDKKRREICDDDRCSDSAQNGPMLVQLWTKPKDARAFAAFATFTGERVGCAELGAAEVERTWTRGDRKKSHCKIGEGTLKGLGVLVSQSTDKAETDVTVFSPSWPDHDVDLRDELKESGM